MSIISFSIMKNHRDSYANARSYHIKYSILLTSLRSLMAFEKKIMLFFRDAVQMGNSNLRTSQNAFRKWTLKYLKEICLITRVNVFSNVLDNKYLISCFGRIQNTRFPCGLKTKKYTQDLWINWINGYILMVYILMGL